MNTAASGSVDTLLAPLSIAAFVAGIVAFGTILMAFQATGAN